jgi:transketolase
MREPKDLRDAVIEALLSAKEKGLPVMVLLSDSASTSKIASFASKYPDHVVNVGIAEQNLVGVAAGMSLTGFISVTANAAPFLLHRSYEQVKIDVCYNKTNVKLLGLNAGVAYGQLGSTHHASDDIAIVRNNDTVLIFAPADAVETFQIVQYALEYVGPVYIRLDNIKVTPIHDDSYRFIPGAIDMVRVGKDALVCSLGTLLSEALKGSEILSKKGIEVSVANFSSLRPLDKESLISLLRKHSRVITLEEHSLHGGLASIIREVIVAESLNISLTSLGIPEGETTLAGDRDSLRKHYGLDGQSVANAVSGMLH